MPYLTAEQKTERDELVARLLAGAGPAGITEYELDRRLKTALGLPRNMRVGSGAGRHSLARLEAAGRARSVTEPHHCRAGFRRLWFPVLLAWLVLLTHLAVGDCCGFPDSKPPWPQG